MFLDFDLSFFFFNIINIDRFLFVICNWIFEIEVLNMLLNYGCFLIIFYLFSI